VALASDLLVKFYNQVVASADPVYSTATFPSTATGMEPFYALTGTNWVATTSTYPIQRYKYDSL